MASLVVTHNRLILAVIGDLGGRQMEKVLNAIKEFWNNNGYAPTTRELCDMTGYKSTSTVNAILIKLKNMGAIEFEPCKSRSIKLVDRNTDKELRIDIKYFLKIEPLKEIAQGDLIDLRSAVDVKLKKGEYKAIPLGIGMRLPEGYEAHVHPRSSTYKNFKIIQANSVGIIDNSYSGNNDQWHFPCIAMEDTEIHKGDRICQFRIVKNQPKIKFNVVENLDEVSRGGFGSTGV